MGQTLLFSCFTLLLYKIIFVFFNFYFLFIYFIFFCLLFYTNFLLVHKDTSLKSSHVSQFGNQAQKICDFVI
jgi:hypothetical protein